MRAAAEPDLRLALAPDLAQRGAGAGEMGQRHPDIGIGREGIGNEAVENRILVEPPPMPVGRRSADKARIPG